MDASTKDVAKEKRRVVYVALLLVVATVIVYWGIFRSDFVYYDDDVYVITNTHVLQGLSWKDIKWAFTTIYASNWHPLTWLSHMLDVQLFGFNPAGHHFTNLFFHVLATLLLFGFLRYASGKLWISAFVATLFALHPAHVESVAWVAERKDVLSAVFWFATMWAYAYYTRRPGICRYMMVLILFVLGLLTKPMLVTLPFILLLLDYWPLERLLLYRRSFGRLVAEKLPLLVIAVASAIITVIAQQEAIAGINRFYLVTRITNAVESYCVYLGQAVWPSRLAVFYPYVQHPLPIKVVACALLLVTITTAVVWIGRQKKYLVTGWLWYIVTLIPVIGIVQVGGQSHADRYTYIPFIGIFILIVWGLNTITDKMQNSKKLIMKIALVVMLLAMTVKTWEQVGYWKSDFTLFSHAIAVTKKNYIAYNNLGFQFERTGRTSDAITQYQKALEINSNYCDAHYNLANLLLQIDRTDEAIAHYRKALEINPNKINALNNLAGAYVQLNQLTDAMPLIQRALALAKSAGDESQEEELTANLEKLRQTIGSLQKP